MQVQTKTPTQTQRLCSRLGLASCLRSHKIGFAMVTCPCCEPGRPRLPQCTTRCENNTAEPGLHGTARTCCHASSVEGEYTDFPNGPGSDDVIVCRPLVSIKTSNPTYIALCVHLSVSVSVFFSVSCLCLSFSLCLVLSLSHAL